MVKDKRYTQTEMLMDIRERLAKIETHLKDMNGRIIKHERFITEDCPQKHKDMTEEMTKISDKTLVLTTKQTLVYGFFFAVFIAIISGFLPTIVKHFFIN